MHQQKILLDEIKEFQKKERKKVPFRPAYREFLRKHILSKGDMARLDNCRVYSKQFDCSDDKKHKAYTHIGCGNVKHDPICGRGDAWRRCYEILINKLEEMAKLPIARMTPSLAVSHLILTIPEEYWSRIDYNNMRSYRTKVADWLQNFLNKHLGDGHYTFIISFHPTSSSQPHIAKPHFDIVIINGKKTKDGLVMFDPKLSDDVFNALKPSYRDDCLIKRFGWGWKLKTLPVLFYNHAYWFTTHERYGRARLLHMCFYSMRAYVQDINEAIVKFDKDYVWLYNHKGKPHRVPLNNFIRGIKKRWAVPYRFYSSAWYGCMSNVLRKRTYELFKMDYKDKKTRDKERLELYLRCPYKDCKGTLTRTDIIVKTADVPEQLNLDLIDRPPD